MSDKKWSQLDPRQPASYRITFEGSLDENWMGRLGGMQITTTTREAQKPVTTLSVQVRDQAALIGVLNSLYQLHTTILSVNRESCRESSDDSQPDSHI